MFIDQAKIMEKYTQTVGNEQGKVHMPNDCEPQSVFDFGKLKESYRMTEGGSFFMPNAVYQDGIERVVVRVDKKSLLPTALGYDMAGIGLWINIAKIAPTSTTPTIFKPTIPDGYEVIDFR